MSSLKKWRKKIITYNVPKVVAVKSGYCNDLHFTTYRLERKQIFGVDDIEQIAIDAIKKATE